MMKIVTVLSTVVLTAGLAQASVVTSGTTTLLSTSQNDVGSAVIDLTAGSASASGDYDATVTPLGDGTVSEYLFFNAVGVSDATAGSMNVYTSLGSAISTPTFPSLSLGGNKSNVELTLPDGITVFDTNTGGNGSDLNGTIDTSIYDSGTVYFIFGTSADYAQVSFGGELSGFLGTADSVNDPDHADISEFDFTGTTVSGNGTVLAAFSFDNVADGAVDTVLDYRIINTDYDGSRAKVYGVVVDGVAVPEPATLGLVAVFGGGVLFIRRRFMM